MKDIVKSYFVTDKMGTDKCLEVKTLDELMDALKVFKNDFQEDHAHVQVYGSTDGGLTNTLFIAEFTVKFNNDIDFVTYGI